MAKVKLELEKLEILRPKERWKLYFLMLTENPENPEETIFGVVPQKFMMLKPRMDNLVEFEPHGVGTDGIILMNRDIPDNKIIKCSINLFHSRKNARGIGDLITDIKSEFGTDLTDIGSNLLGITNPWMLVAKTGISVVESGLKKLKDRHFGSVNLSEEFGDEFISGKELDRDNKFSSGDAHLYWSWKLKV